VHDIAENSINAKAKNVRLVIKETDEIFYFLIEDDAGGIRPDILEKIFDPFVTTRKKRLEGWDSGYLFKAIRRSNWWLCKSIFRIR